jgi:2-amino-4-hydroxy-6-hydroxymethyldihydropteridine diphosphokinase
VSRAFIGLGANLGSPREAIAAAVEAIASRPGLKLTGVSGLYRSAPVEAQGPDFFNAVIRIESTLDAPRLLGVLQEIEAQAGRQRPYPNAPRTLDLDLLLFADQVMESATLTLPHPRMHRRAFVLRPLAEIDADLRIPGRGALRELLEGCADQVIARDGPLPPRTPSGSPGQAQQR